MHRNNGRKALKPKLASGKDRATTLYSKDRAKLPVCRAIPMLHPLTPQPLLGMTMNTHRPRPLLAIHATDSKSKTARRPITATSLSAFLVLMLGFTTCPATHAASGTWNVDADGNWSNGANWTPGVADGATFTANLTFNLTGNRLITLDSSRSLGVLNIGDADATNSYTLATGVNTLTFDNGASDAQLNQISTANGATISGLLAIGGNGKLTITNAASAKTLTLSAGITSALTSSTQTLTFNNANAVSVSGIIADGSLGGAITLIKTGAGTTTLTAANTYTGATTINQGTLALSGGNNRLATTGTLTFSGATGTLDIGANSQTLSTIAFVPATASAATINGTGGTLNLNGATILIGGTANNVQSVNLTGLSNFNYNNALGTLEVGAAGQGGTGRLILAGTNVITASTVKIGSSTNSTAGLHYGEVQMGQTNTINADSIVVGVGAANGGTLKFQTALVAPTLKIRGSGGTDSDRAAITVGSNAGYVSNAYGLFDTTGGVLDAKISTLLIGQNIRTGSIPNTSGTFIMAGGTLDATTITLGQNIVASNTTGATTATFTQNGGIVTAVNLNLDERNAGNGNVVANYNLNGGTLNATTIKMGVKDSGNANFTWADGTIGNITGSNQTVTLSTSAYAPTVAFILTNTGNTSGTHTWNVSGSNISTVSAVISGEGSLTKIGTGTLTFGAANTYTGDTFANFGTLATNATGKFGTGNITVANGAKLTLGNNASIGDLSTLTFDSTSTAGSISLNFSGVETLGAVYDSITATYLAGGTYTAAQLNSAFLTSVFTGIGSLTVSAIPEPSTYAALFGALALAGAFCKRRRSVRR
jgi:autotransporter-associated beta strand protein